MCALKRRTGRAAVPSGATRNTRVGMRDSDKTASAAGREESCRNVNNEMSPILKGWDARDQAKIDNKLIELDGTPNKKKLGANALLGFHWRSRTPPRQRKSSAVRYLGGDEARVLPVPMMNILNGGAHSDAPIDFQEFMIVRAARRVFRKRCVMAPRFFMHSNLSSKSDIFPPRSGRSCFAPQLDSAEDAIESISTAVNRAGYKTGRTNLIALDPAASEFYDSKNDLYIFKKSDVQKKPLNN